MNQWAAFLRGVNVGGITVTSARLRACLTALGLFEVQTVLASGNAVFANDGEASVLKRSIEQALREHFGYDAWIVLMNRATVHAAIEGCTLAPREGWHTYYLLGSDDAVLRELAGLTQGEPAASGPGVLYWQVREGETLHTPFAKVLSKARYRTSTTMRNARTMARVAALLGSAGTAGMRARGA